MKAGTRNIILLMCLAVLCLILPAQKTYAEEDVPGTDIPVLGIISADGTETLYIVDLSRYVPEGLQLSGRTVKGIIRGIEVTFITDTKNEIYILYTIDGDGNVRLFAYNTDTDEMYECHDLRVSGSTYYYMSAYACGAWPDGLTMEAVEKENIFYLLDDKGNGGYFHIDSNADLVEWDSAESGYSQTGNNRVQFGVFAVMAAAAVLVSAASAASFSLTVKLKKKEAARQKELLERQRAARVHFTSYDWELMDLEALIRNETESEEERLLWAILTEAGTKPAEDAENSPENVKKSSENAKKPSDDVRNPSDDTLKTLNDGNTELQGREEAPVIEVRNVTMLYRISTSNASGIKEYMIQRLKRQVSFRVLVALDNISFDVFRGEVVGIIGTNGSGKSTLLKIISGGLKPSRGSVNVDRRKIQILTLGTGFDMELSARENIYLNGSIIGYTKEFLDSHYKEIVDFAELDGFMEEKVKNFSSGMVSRLGFAIATAGDAAEILILDEVLSVGDEFFRKKSLKRIKEMIHGGSTVLMVSHGMGTITENCTKVVWIEKGVLRMVGEPRTVCGEYQRQ